MVFEIKDKVALITGGASGIGLQFAKELLRKGAKGVTLADVDSKSGESALKEIEVEFGKNKAIYVKTNVTDKNQLENAFQETVKKFNNIDIFFNNAGVYNDAIYEKEIAVNLIGYVHGMILAFDNYLQKNRQGDESVIVNTASITGLANYGNAPVYSATKAAIISMTRCWGIPHHYEKTKVKCIAICPGVTITPLVDDRSGKSLGERYETALPENLSDTFSLQGPEYVAEETIKLIQNVESGTIWVIEGGEPAYEYIFPDRETMKGQKRK